MRIFKSKKQKQKLDPEVLSAVIRLNDLSASKAERLKAMFYILDYGAADTTSEEDKRQLMHIIKDHISDQYPVSEALKKWNSLDFLDR